MSDFWHKLNDLFDQPAGNQIRWLVGYLMDQQAQAEAEMAGREAEKEAELEGDRRWQEYLSLFMPGAEAQIPPVITDPKTGAQYSIPDDYAPATPGGPLAEAYPQAYEILSMLGPEMLGMPGVAGQAFAPPEEELPPESVDMREMATVIDLMRGDRGYGYPAQEVRALAESAGLDLDKEIEAFTENPEIWTDIFPAAEAPTPEPLLPNRYYFNEETQQYEFLGAPGDVEYFGGPSTGIYGITPEGQAGWVLEPPAEPQAGDYVSPTNISGVGLLYENEDGSLSQIETRMNTALQGALYEAMPHLRNIGVSDIVHVGAYNVREARTLSGEPLGYQSVHAQGLAIDLKGFHDAQGVYHPVSNMSDPLVQQALGILNQFPDFVNEGPVWHVGVGREGFNLPTLDTDALEEPARLSSAELEDQFWNGLTPGMIVERVNAAGGQAQLNEINGTVFIANPPPQGMDYLYRQYDQELRAAENASGEAISELGGMTRDEAIDLVNTFQPQSLPEMVEIMLYVQALGIDDPPWWGQLTERNKRLVQQGIQTRMGNR